MQKTQLVFTFCYGVSKKIYYIEEFQKGLALHVLTSELKAVLGTISKQTDLYKALINETL